jgi:transposase
MSIESTLLSEFPIEHHPLIVNLHQRLEEQESRYKRLTEDSIRKLAQIESENRILREQVKLLTQKIYGKSSEKYIADNLSEQQNLFLDEAEESVEVSAEEETDVITVPEHTRKKRGGSSIPNHIPRIEIIHDLPQEEQVDSFGRPMKLIGKIKSEKLCMEPARFWVEVHVRYKYASITEGIGDEDGEIKLSPLPVQLLPKSIGSPSLVSHILTSKYADSLPFYRQEQQFLRKGLFITRGTMCSWALKVWELCQPLKELLFNQLHSGPRIQMDETYTQVICEDDRPATSQSFMFVARGGPPSKPTIYYHYSPVRNSQIVKGLLKDFKGIVQSDGHVIYDYLDNVEGINHCGCWAHARRYFKKVIDVLPKKSKQGQAVKMLKQIKNLYSTERKADNLQLSPEERLSLRQEESKPVVDKIKELLEETHPQTNPNSYLGKATTYMTNQWSRLIKFLENGCIAIDNNRVENDIRPFCVGRKNWLFSYSEDGANASAFFYSLIQTAKANGLEPQSYLNHLFQLLPKAVTKQEQKKLLPQYIDPTTLKPVIQN